MAIQDDIDKMPISRVLTLEKYERDLQKMVKYLALFHDELLVTDHKDDTADIMYARIHLQYIYDGVKQAYGSLKALHKHLEECETSTTGLAYKVKQANAKALQADEAKEPPDSLKTVT